MREFILTVPENLAGRDIKYILKNHFGFSSSLITALKDGDGIMLCGKKEFVNKKTALGDVLKITLFDKASENITPQNMPLDILYEDEDLLAVAKPPKMPTHPSIYHTKDTLANAVLYYFRDIPFTFRAPSRLDRDTSGVLIVAKNAWCAERISNEIKNGEFKKEYVAVCVGIPKDMHGTISAPIKREKQGIIKRTVAPDGKSAVTDYEVIKTLGNLSLLRLYPKTGRTHQIRLHLSHIGTPIYGDFLYGEEVLGERIRLHCRSVSFVHPFSKELITVTAPLPPDMELDGIKKL